MKLYFANLPVFILYTYGLAYGLMPLIVRGQFGWFVAGLLVLNVLAWFLFDLLFYSGYYIITHWLHQPSSFKADTWLFYTPFPGYTFWETNMTAGLFVCLKFFQWWQQKQAESQQLERDKLQTELQLLKLQLNPDFLFGSLQALHTLMQQQSTLAPGVVLKLAQFLRYILYESRSDRMPLLREIEIIEHYVSLQRAIHPVGLEVSFSVRGNPANRMVAPLLLFQFVEHAFRNLPAERPNLQTDEPAWVSIDLTVTEAQLTLKVIDGQMNNLTDNSNQLVDVQKQLHFHYADRYDLQVHAEPEAYIVTLTLPFILSAASPAGQLVNPQSSPDYETTLPDRGR